MEATMAIYKSLKYSPRIMLHELISQNERCFICGNRANEDSIWTCVECDNYVLCSKCFGKYRHEHIMEKLEQWQSKNLDILKLLLDVESDQKRPVHAKEHIDEKRLSLDQRIQLMAHASYCEADKCQECTLIICQKMKKVMRHNQACQEKFSGNCFMCQQLHIVFCYHAQQCNEPKCPVPTCLKTQQEHKERLQKHKN